jgi:hypothetical protein
MSSDEKLADALFALLDAKEELDEARRNAPSYTAQYSSEDFYRDEKKAYDEAVEAYAEAVRDIQGPAPQVAGTEEGNES